MMNVVISDTDGNEFETLDMNFCDVAPYVELIKLYGYLSDGGDNYKFVRAQVLTDKYVYVDVEIK